MSRFDIVRAKWETQYPHRGSSSPTMPLLRAETSNMASKSNTQPSNPGRRLTTGLGMLNKPLKTIRNKTFNRSRQSSSETQVGGSRDGLVAGRLAKVPAIAQRAKENTKMVKSQTMSFLPVPAKPPTRSTPALPKLVSSKSTASLLLEKPRIPTPSKSRRPSYLPRSTTHPTLGTAVVTGGRRASEFTRRQSSQWPLLDDTTPLLRTPLVHTPTIEDDYFRTKPKTFLDQAEDDYAQESPTQHNFLWGAIDSPSKSNSHPHLNVYEGKENVHTGHSTQSASPLNRSGRIIQYHQLLQPIQPLSPLSGTMPGAYPESSPAIPIIPSKPPVSDSRPIFTNRKNLQRPTPLDLSPKRSFNAITTAQPNSYWSGRFSTLQDRILNETFDVSGRPMTADEVDSSSSSTVSLLRHTHSNTARESSEGKRAERIFQILDEACATDQARRSLLIFRNMYAIKMKMPFLKCEIPPTAEMKVSMEKAAVDGGSDTGGGSMGSALSAGLRKISFMDRLRGRKSSGKSVASGLRE